MKVTLVRLTESLRFGWLALAVCQHCSNSQTQAPASLPSSSKQRGSAASCTVIFSIGVALCPSIGSTCVVTGYQRVQFSLSNRCRQEIDRPRHGPCRQGSRSL